MTQPDPIPPGYPSAADLNELRPTLTRLARVAKTLFGVSAADVTLFVGERIWRASDKDGQFATTDPASELTRLNDDVVWVEDLRKDERFRSHDMVTAGLRLRFFAGAPIRLEGGQRVGTLGVFDQKPKAYDARLAARLMDLAGVVAHEFSRAQAVRERDALLDEMARSEQRLRIAVQNADLHVFEMDYERKRLFKAGAEDTFFERPMTYEALARDIWASIHPDDVGQAAAAWKRHLKTGEVYSPEYRVRRSDGKEVWALGTAELITDPDGRPLRLIGALQNITGRKAAETAMAEAKAQAEAANVAKSTFLATMSHEIRTPLNGVLGMAQAMAADITDPIQRDRLQVIRESGEALLAILNDVLDLSKIEAGKLELEEIEFDLGEVVRGAHAAFTSLANKNGLSFALDIEPALGVYRGDPTRLRQILYNLISNALKFTSAGEIRVTARRLEERLELAVTDTGIGMTAETVAGLFAKFVQADASTTRRFGGTGLGLAICHELVELMGGEIRVDSAPGRGSTFTVSVPLPRLGDARATPTGPAPSEPEIGPALELRVLAAEDNTVNQLVLKTLLHQLGVDPFVVENGELAVRAWEEGAYDVILMDVQMPEMDGLTATRLIRQREAETGRRRTPILALTANAMSHQVEEYLACGMDAHVPKPIEAGRLFETLGRLLQDGEPAVEDAAL